MKNKLFTRVCVAVLIAALLMVGCSGTEGVSGPSNHSKYASVLGLSKEEACKSIGIQQEDMTETAKGLYTTPLTAQFAGQTFDVYLSVNTLSEKQELLSIKYCLKFADLSDTTIQAVDDIVDTLKEQYGEPARQSDSQREDERLPAAYTYWDLTETVSEDLSAFMKQLEAEYGGTAYYELLLNVDQYEGICEVVISYIVGVTPSK